MDLLAATASSAALDTIGGGLSANVALAVSKGARRSTMGAAPMLSAEPNAANARTDAGIATSLHNAAIAANRGFMINLSNEAGLHSQTCGEKDFCGHDVDKQWRKMCIFSFSIRVLLKCNAPHFERADQTVRLPVWRATDF
jgi:hypothetical protein